MKVPVGAFITSDAWRLSGAVKLRIYANQSFWNSDGQWVPQGVPGRAQTAYLELNCTVSGTQLIIPSFEIDSTVDGLDNVFATYDAEFVVGGRRIPFLNSFPVNTLEVGDPSTTWPEIIILRNLFEPQTLDDNLTRQLANLVQVAAGDLNKASLINTGVTALDVDPLDPVFPIAVGINSPLLQVSSVFVNALTNGLVDDGQVIEDAVVNLGTPTTLTSAVGGLDSSIVDKVIAVAGAGPAGATLITAIAGVPDANTITLANAVTTAVTNTRAVYGTDNRTALQTLADSISGVSGKSTIYLPKGNYLFSVGDLVLPQGVGLQGSWASAPDHLGYRFADEPKPMDGEGTTFVVVADEGGATGSFIFLNSESSVRGISFFYPSELSTLTTPKLYPWTIEMFGAGSTVEHVELVNPYQGIYSHIGWRQRVADVRGLPLLTGLYASQQLDSSTYKDIDFIGIYTYGNPEGSGTLSNLMAWIHQNGTAFKFGRVDNGVCYNCFSFGYFKGFKFVVDAPEVTTFAGGLGAPGGKAWVEFTDCGADGCNYPVDIDDVQGFDTTGAMGVTFTNGMFNAAQIVVFGGPELNAVWLRATCTGRVGLVNCRFHLANRCIQHDNGKLNVVGCFFQDWTVNAVVSASGTSTFTGNTFKLGSATPIVVITGSPWTSWAGNLFEYQDHAVWNLSATANFSEGGNTYSDSPMEVAVTFQNGWANLGGFKAVTYKKRDGVVRLQGAAQGGVVAAGTPVFTLPAGFRPTGVVEFPVPSGGTFGAVQIDTNGIVSVTLGSNASLFLDGITFPVR